MKNKCGFKVVVMGGGSGLSVILKGLKLYTKNITAIVTVGDDGGSSGILRDDLGILPPGDIRNCLTALADDENEMSKLLSFRFDTGSLKGQSMGNLLIAAMCCIRGNFAEAVKAVSDVLKISGTVLPVTLDDMRITAELDNNEKITGESCIPLISYASESPIKRIYIEPKNAKAFHYCIEALLDADIIIIGPGSLYTSVIPNLLIDGIQDALIKSNAKKFYCCNIMTQRGETDDFTVSSHLKAIENHLYDNEKIFDYVLYNTNVFIENDIIKYYQSEGSYIVTPGNLDIYKEKYTFIADNFLSIKDKYIIHNIEKIINYIAVH